MTVQPLPKSIDLSHHLNAVSKGRHASPLKDIMPLMARPGMISFAGGLPHPSLFPFADAAITAYPPSADLSVDAAPKNGLVPIEMQKYAVDKAQVDLSQILQYGYSSGDPRLRAWLADYVTHVHQPATSDWEILLHCGNTDGWNKVVRLLCDPGDLILCEEYTFASSISMWTSFGCRATPVKLDGNGLRADDLERVLGTWETEHPNEKRPKLLYIVPVGSNPTGSTMPADRRQQIYDICSKYDVIIAEDDPYSALQYPSFELSDKQEAAEPTVQTAEEFRASLEPSFLKFDKEGRVIRLESFSKTIAPGNRLGFFVANPLFTERLLRATEVETQTPSGWAQGIVYELLRQWGRDGYLSWLSNLRQQYQIRRDGLCGAIAEVFTALPASSSATGIPGAEGIAVYPPGTNAQDVKPDQLPLFSLVAPTGGMFLWCRFYLAGARRFRELTADEAVADPEKTFIDELFLALAENSVLLTPGSYYVPYISADKETTKARGAEEQIGYFRFAFSTATSEEMLEGIRRLEQVVKKYWEY
ncbi:hypothetical protein JCM6882_006760 [Rhodosporidiobolus microsporus]